MAIFRGVGGAGTASDNAFLLEISEASEAAQAAAEQAEQSALAAVNAEVSSATFNTSDGVLTLTKTGGATVTADLDGRFLTSYTETNDLSSAVTWANVPDANITESSVTQHLTAANVTGVLTGGTGISIASNGTITNDSPDQTVALTGTGATTITGTYPNFTIDSTNTTYTVGDGGLTTNDFTDADHSKLDGIEANADVTDTANVTSAGAAMLASSPTFTGTITAPNVDISTTGTVTTNIATGSDNGNNTDVKIVNIGTGYGSGFFAGDSTTINIGSQASNAKNIFNIGNGTTSGTGENTINLKGNVDVSGTVDGFIDIRNFYQSLNHSTGSSQFLTTTFTSIGGTSEYTHSGIGTKTIDVSLDILYYNVSYTNDAELRFVVTAPNPSTEDVVSLGNVVATSNPASYITQLEFSGDFTKHFSNYAGLAKNSDGSSSIGTVYRYGYDGANNRTLVQMSTQSQPPSVGSPLYLHPFDWESSGTSVISPVYQLDFTTDSTVLTRRDYNEHLGYFASSVAVETQMRESTTSENVVINEFRGKLTRVGN